MNKKNLFSATLIAAAIAVLAIGFIGTRSAQWFESGGEESDDSLTNTDTSDVNVGTSFQSEM